MNRFFDQFPAFYTSPVSAHPNRLHQRYRAIIESNRAALSGAKVVDIGAHDGRWSFAARHAGAEHVTMIEPRPAAVTMARTRFAEYSVPCHGFTIVQEDVSHLLGWIADQRFDVVLLLGFLYHTGDHLRLMEAINASEPSVVVIDSEVIDDAEAVIRYRVERDQDERCAYASGRRVITGTPSAGMIDMMLTHCGFRVFRFNWSGRCDDWHAVGDYQRHQRITVTGRRERHQPA
jgi:hypothetical protein